jgi:hypothetical protein
METTTFRMIIPGPRTNSQAENTHVSFITNQKSEVYRRDITLLNMSVSRSSNMLHAV